MSKPHQGTAGTADALDETILLDQDTFGKKEKLKLSQVKDGIFFVMFRMAEDAWPSAPVWAVILWVYDLLQMLMLPLNPSLNMPWREQPYMLGLHNFLSAVSLLPTKNAVTASSPALSLYMAAIVSSVLMVALFVWTIFDEVTQSSYRPKWRFAVLRTGGRIMLAGFTVPILTNLVAPFSCTAADTWMDSGMTCFSGGHIGLIVASVLTLPFVLGFLCLNAACLVNRVQDPAGKKNALSSPHGRVDLALVVLKVALAFLYVFVPSSSPWAPAVLSIVISLVWAYLFVEYLPYHRMWLNRLQVALAGVHLAAGVAAVLSLALTDRKYNAGALVFFFLVPPVVYCGQAIVAFRFNSFRNASDLTTPFMVEIRARFMVTEASDQSATMRNVSGNRRRAAAAAEAEDSSDAENNAITGLSAQSMGKSAHSGGTGVRGGAGGAASEHGSTIRGGSKSRHDDNRSQRSGASRPTGQTNASSMTQNAKLIVRRYLQNGTEHTPQDYNPDVSSHITDLDRSINAMYLEAIDAFSNSAFCELFAAHWFGVVCDNNHLERIHLQAAVAKADSAAIDIHFFVAARRMALKEVEDRSNKNAMTVERRMMFEKLMSTSRQQVLMCRQFVVSFWSILSEKQPDLFRLQGLGMQLNEAMLQTDQLFAKLLEMSSESAPVMRAYADYLLEVANDPRKAMDLLTDAEQIEDEQTRALSQRVESDIIFGRLSNLDISAEALGLIRVSAELETMGTIVEVNAAALKLFGYNRREMMGRDISSIVPEPMQSVHHMFLSRYCDDGREHIVNSSRMYMALHRAGHIFPVRCNIRPTGNDWSAVAEEVPTTQSVIMFTGAETGWKITAVCKSSQALLNVDIQAMRAGVINVRSFLPNVEDTIAGLLLHRDGGVITLRNVASSYGTGADTSVGQTKERGWSSTAVVKAKLQVIRVPFVGSAVFLLRFRRATALDRDTAAAMRRAIDGDDAAGQAVAEDSESSREDEHDARSDEAERSDSDEAGGRLLVGPALSGTVKPVAKLALPAGRRATPPAGHPAVDDEDDIQLCPVFKKPAGGEGPGNRSRTGSAAGSGAGRVNFGSTAYISPPGSGAASKAGTPPGSKPGSAGSQRQVASALFGAGTDGGDVEAPAAASGSVSSLPGEVPVTDKVRRNSDIEPHPLSLIVAKAGSGEEPPSGLRQRHKGPRGRLSNDDATDGDHPAHPAEGAAMRAAKSPPLKASMPNGIEPKQGSSRRKLTSEGPANKSSGRIKEGVLVTAGPRSSNITSKGSDVEGTGRQTTRASQDEERSVARNSAIGDRSQGRGSNASGSTGSTGSSATEILRKGIMMRSLSLEVSLITLRRSVIVVFLIAAVINSTSLGICLALFQQLVNNMELVTKNGDRGVLLQRSYGSIQRLSAVAQGLSNENETFLRTRAESYVTEFETLHQELYLAVDGQIPAETKLYTEPIVNVTDLVPGEFVSLDDFNATTRTINLVNGGLEFVAKVRRIINYKNVSQIHRADPDTFWILMNGYIPLRNAFNDSMLLANDRSALQADVISLTNLILLAVALGMFAIVAALVMSPAVFKVHASKAEIMRVFLEVPVPIIRALRALSLRKLAAIRRANEEAEAGLDVAREADLDVDEGFMLHDDEDPLAGGGAGGAPTGAKSAAGGEGPSGQSVASGKSNVSLSKAIAAMAAEEKRAIAAAQEADAKAQAEAVKNCCGRTKKVKSTADAVHHGKHHNRQYRRATSARIGMLFRMLWPIVLYMSFYIAMYLYRESAVTFARYAKSEVLWSKQAEFYVSQLNYNLRLALMDCEPIALRANAERATSAIRVVNDYVDSLMYGSTFRELRAGLQVSPATFNLFMSHGCVDNAGWFYEMSECETTFFDKLVAHGLLGSFKVYVQMIATVLDRRLDQVLMAAQDPLNHPCTFDEVHKEDVKTVQRLADQFLAAGFARASDIRSEEAYAYFATVQSTNIIVTVMSIIVLFIYYVALYKPMMARLDKEIKNVRSLLLLFPDEVAQAAPAILDAGRRMLRLGGPGSA